MTQQRPAGDAGRGTSRSPARSRGNLADDLDDTFRGRFGGETMFETNPQRIS